MDMTPLLTTLNSWGDANHVRVEPRDDSVELTWNAPSGESCFISVYPDEAGDIVVLQHGMYGSPLFRHQQGVSRSRCADLPLRLSQLKETVEQIPKQTWKYAPHIEIGTVNSLKLH